MLEVAVSSLEEQMIGLKMQIRHERSERLHNAACQTASPLKQKGKVLLDRLEDLPCNARDLRENISLCKSKGPLEQVNGPESSEKMVQSAMHLSNCSQQCTITSGITSLTEEDIASAQSCTTSNDSISSNSVRETSGLDTHRHAEADMESLQYTDLRQVQF